MNTTTKKIMFIFAALTLTVKAQIPIDYTHDRVQTSLDPGFKRIGTISPRSAKEVGRSNIAIGCEMLPRDYGDFEEFKMYIPPLGISRIRLHAGWTKIEPEKGVYDFEWLDRQVNYLVENGMDVLLETSYGNPLYPGGGGASLSDGMPHGEVALAAWDKYVDALSKHYSHIKDWACWNEPTNTKKNTPKMVADNNIRTAEIIKKNIPDARIAGLLVSWPHCKFTKPYMQELKKRNKTDLFT
ncbi:MAG: beta-galactosidase [Kiritimatiellia bacterium]